MDNTRFFCLLIGCVLIASYSHCSEPSRAKDGQHGVSRYFEDGENGEDGANGVNGQNGGHGGNGGESLYGNGGHGGNGGDAE